MRRENRVFLSIQAFLDIFVNSNKAGYTAIGAPKHLFKRVNKKDGGTDGQTDGRTDPLTEVLRRT